ncbi:MAG: heme A synthase [Flammeovirgaceae bacterium]|nr:heme A synthase [Flammeovirgaceae bacterium]HCX21472.1 heme A synthase [Cytophagales bacterium]|tara:strand:+ start:281 stop:1294 length:1014 start_codon:yes stop_codon:yes gene_type:complete
MKRNNLAYRVNLVTIIAVYFLILVGGIVRSMGAGMGCPDWPKCFGSYVPPTDESALPEGYEQMYVDSRVKKNARLSNTLAALGFDQLSTKVSNDPNIREVTRFDVQKAWVEYVNRLVGVVIGILIVLNMAFALKYWKTNRKVVILSVISFILVLFQGWIGSLVVSTNLLPGFISFHMMLALLLVCLLITQGFLMKEQSGKQIWGRPLLLGIFGLFAIQIVLGVQVREEIDWIKSMTDLVRSQWLEEVGSIFYVHRTYSLLLAGLIGWFAYSNWKKGTLTFSIKLLVGVVIAEILLGIILTYANMPAFAQPIHLLLASVAFGAIFYLFLCTNLRVKNS